jgi:hypothetical protein
VRQPASSPDIAPYVLYQFLNLKILKVKRFDNVETLEHTALEQLLVIPKIFV